MKFLFKCCCAAVTCDSCNAAIVSQQVIIVFSGERKKNPYTEFPVRIYCLPRYPGDEEEMMGGGLGQLRHTNHTIDIHTIFPLNLY